MTHPPPSSTLFPYTTLFRSAYRGLSGSDLAEDVVGGGVGVVAVEELFECLVELVTVQSAGTVEVQSGENGGAVLAGDGGDRVRSEEHTSELQSHVNLVCRLL